MNLFNEGMERTKEVVKLRTNPDGSIHVEVGDVVLYKYLKTEKTIEEMEMEGLDLFQMLQQPRKEVTVPAIVYALNGQDQATLALMTGDATQPLAYVDDQHRGTGIEQWQPRA